MPSDTSLMRINLSKKNAFFFNLDATFLSSTLWLPGLTLCGSIGLMLSTCAYTLGRLNWPGSSELFWIGILVLFVPICIRLLSSYPNRNERIVLVIVLGFGFYMLKVLHSPSYFTFSDEHYHWRNTINILKSNRLFLENSLLPPTAFYPGLSIVTASLVKTTGMSIFITGIIVLGVARVLFMVTLFLFFERVSSSAYIAGISSIIYMANPNFLFFDAQFSYETLALPIALFVLWAISYRENVNVEMRLGLNVAVFFGIITVAVTHHITSYILLIYIGIWTLVTYIMRRVKWADRPGPYSAGALIFVVVTFWMIYAATLTVGYLGPNLISGFIELVRLINGESASRELFRSFSGLTSPLWEQYTGYIATLLVLFGIPMGLLHIWRNCKKNPLIITLAIISITYPALLALRFTTRGAEISNRSTEFLFIAISVVLAISVASWIMRLGNIAILACTIFATTIVMGGIIVGWAFWARIPGPYMIGADTRSIDLQSIEAARWTAIALGPDQRFFADRTNRLLLGTYGQQRILTNIADKTDMDVVMFARTITGFEKEVIRQEQVQYILVDRRLSQGLPAVGVYFERGEPNTFRHVSPISLNVLMKFDKVPLINRIFDSGDIIIYDVRELSNAP